MHKFKNDYFKAGLIVGLFIVSLLAALPRIPITFKNNYLNIDTSIGGYYISLFNNKLNLDLREYKKGLDLEGGIKLVLQADMTGIDVADRDPALESSKQVIERRVNYLGVSEPQIITSKSGDDYRIIVEIPGVDNIGAAIDLIGQTAQLNFKQLKPDVEWNESLYQEYFLNPEVWEDSGVTGADLKGADVVLSQGIQQANGSTNAPQIQMKFTNEGREKFAEAAKNNINKPVALFFDEDSFPLSMPIVSPDLANGLFDDPVISGNFDLDSAQALSIQIRAGALPVPVTIISQENVDATLGDESVQASIKAGAVGFALILIFMFILYGKLGLVADFALLIYGVLVLAIFKMIPVVLTLPGIAGFLLSVGMAVDANILIFERITEELKWGRPRSLAVKFGFERAWPAIRDSNISSIITALILFYMGSGQVRGFALTLLIGVLVSLFTAITAVRVFIRVLKFDRDSHERFHWLKRTLSRKKYASN